MSLSLKHLVSSNWPCWRGKNGSLEGYEGNTEISQKKSRMYNKVAPWGLLSGLVTFLSVCHWFCGCKQVSALSLHLDLCAYVGARACGLSTLPDWRLGCVSRPYRQPASLFPPRSWYSSSSLHRIRAAVSAARSMLGGHFLFVGPTSVTSRAGVSKFATHIFPKS